MSTTGPTRPNSVRRVQIHYIAKLDMSLARGLLKVVQRAKSRAAET
jgi:hypothetical protein